MTPLQPTSVPHCLIAGHALLKAHLSHHQIQPLLAHDLGAGSLHVSAGSQSHLLPGSDQAPQGLQDLGPARKKSLAPSDATWGGFNDVTQLMQLEVERSHIFIKTLDAGGAVPAVPAFPWPAAAAGASGKEDEEAGYSGATAFLQEHVCPEGVTAVCVSKQSWLEW